MALPAVLFVVGPRLVDHVSGLDAEPWWGSFSLQTVGVDWYPVLPRSSVWRRDWFGATVDLVLVVLPGVVAAVP